MNPMIVFVVICAAAVSSTYAFWINDIVSPRGLDFGGLTFHLDEIHKKNSTILERIALRMDCGDLGIRLAKAQKRAALELDFYLKNDTVEGRKQSGGSSGGLPFLLGVKSAGVMAVILTVMKALVIKSLIIAKFALAASAILIVAKLMHHEEPKSYVEIEHHGSEHMPVYVEYPHSAGGGGGGGGFQPSASGNYYAYSNYAPTGAESSVNYSTMEASAPNATASGNQQVAAAAATKRQDYVRRKQKLPTIVTVRRYSVET